MVKQNRALLLLLAVALICTMLFSAFYIAVEAEHDCIGEHCRICDQIGVCIQSLKTLSVSVTAAVCTAVLLYIVFSLIFRTVSFATFGTLVLLKVKLSN